MAKRTTGNARKRVRAVAVPPARAAKPTLVQRIQRLETEREVATAGRRELWLNVRSLLKRADRDREETLQHLANALERIGKLELACGVVVHIDEATSTARSPHSDSWRHYVDCMDRECRATQEAIANAQEQVAAILRVEFPTPGEVEHVAEQMAASTMSAINVSAKPRRLGRMLAHPLTPLVIALAALALVGVLTWPVWRLAFLR